MSVALTMTERELQGAVMELLKIFGWTSYHTWNSKHSAAGWPDIFAVRSSRSIAIELKSERGKPTLEQEVWLTKLALAGIPTRLWFPHDWLSGEIEKTLR